MPDVENPLPPSTMRTRASLLFRLRDWRDDATWQEFYDLYYGYVYRHARGSGLGHHEAEDVTSDVFRSVAERIRNFAPQPQTGAFRRWLGNCARWRVIDKLRERVRIPGAAEPAGRDDQATRTDTVERLPATDLDHARLEREWQEQVLESAMARVAHLVAPQHFQVFQLHHRDGWTLVRVARELGISMPSAYVINHRVTKKVAQEVRRLQATLE